MSTNRLLNRILRDEERSDRIEANLNVHLQSYAKNVGRIQDDFKRVVEKINVCDDRVDVHQQKLSDQETFNRAILERMQEMETTIEGQMERIVSLEEEVATLRWRKACTCGEEGKETVIATGSREEGSSKLEYAEEGEEVSSDSSYQSPIVAHTGGKGLRKSVITWWEHVELDATYSTCFHWIHSAHISNVISTCV